MYNLLFLCLASLFSIIVLILGPIWIFLLGIVLRAIGGSSNLFLFPFPARKLLGFLVFVSFLGLPLFHWLIVLICCAFKIFIEVFSWLSLVFGCSDSECILYAYFRKKRKCLPFAKKSSFKVIPRNIPVFNCFKKKTYQFFYSNKLFLC